jgi:hypothetical protein
MTAPKVGVIVMATSEVWAVARMPPDLGLLARLGGLDAGIADKLVAVSRATVRGWSRSRILRLSSSLVERLMAGAVSRPFAHRIGRFGLCNPGV